MAEWPRADGMRLLPVLLGAIVGCIASTSLRAGDLAPLGWLAGCWSNPQGEPGSGEYWQPLAGGTMLGIGRLVREGRTVEYEFLRLHRDGQGRVVYTAMPSGQDETAFIASHVADGSATFENPAFVLLGVASGMIVAYVLGERFSVGGLWGGIGGAVLGQVVGTWRVRRRAA